LRRHRRLLSPFSVHLSNFPAGSVQPPAVGWHSASPEKPGNVPQKTRSVVRGAGRNAERQPNATRWRQRGVTTVTYAHLFRWYGTKACPTPSATQGGVKIR